MGTQASLPTFVDRVRVHVIAGDGGDGAASVHREKFKPFGGPDGGNGGHGGDVVLVVDPQVSSLLDFHFHPHRQAAHGHPGRGGHRDGASGADLVLPVPDGTVVIDPEADPGAGPIADLLGSGTRVVIARGGVGGRGNAALASPRRKVPGFALLGEPGQHRELVLELKTVADVGLVGFPNAGKSSLVAVLSAARPKIAHYPFTTLTPHLGVVQADDGVTFTVADVPGLLPGAAAGRGLGLRFLRHIERCAALVHVLDCATGEPGRDPVSDLDAVEAELAAYGGLADRPRIVALNKVDVPEARELAELVTDELAQRGLPVYAVSAATREGVTELVRGMARVVLADRAAAPHSAPPRIVLRPRARGAPGFQVIRRTSAPGAPKTRVPAVPGVGEDWRAVEPVRAPAPAGERADGLSVHTPVQDSHPRSAGGEVVFEVTGEQPERWVRQTDFGNDEAVGYLADRLARAGVEAELTRLGARPGDAVLIGGVTFDFEPTQGAGDFAPLGPRGSDRRLDSGMRPSRAARSRRPPAG